MRVELLTLTHGEAGSCGDPPLCSRGELASIRARELQCACTALGIQPPRLLSYPDGKSQKAETEAMVARIITALEEVNPQVWLSFGPDGFSGHPDHLAVGRAAHVAFDHYGNSAVLYTLAVAESLTRELGIHHLNPVADKAITMVVNVSSVWRVKMKAMRCHRTQWSSSPMFEASKDRQRRFFGREYFVRAACRDAGADFIPQLLKEQEV